MIGKHSISYPANHWPLIQVLFVRNDYNPFPTCHEIHFKTMSKGNPNVRIYAYIHTHKYTYILYTYIHIYIYTQMIIYIYIHCIILYIYIYYLHKWLKHIRVSISVYHRRNRTGCTSHISGTGELALGVSVQHLHLSFSWSTEPPEQLRRIFSKSCRMVLYHNIHDG